MATGFAVITFIHALVVLQDGPAGYGSSRGSQMISAPIIDVRVTLPEHWRPIPLTDENATRDSVRGLVEHEFDGVADKPLSASHFCRALLEQAEAGQAIGGRLLALCRQWHNGTPVPASLLLIWMDLPAGPGSVPGDQLLNLRDRLHGNPAHALPAGQTLDLAALPPGSALRHVLIDETANPSTDQGDHRIPVLVGG